MPVSPELTSKSLQLNLATTSLLQVSIALEDPFDSQALDNIFADEALLEARLVCAASNLFIVLLLATQPFWYPL